MSVLDIKNSFEIHFRARKPPKFLTLPALHGEKSHFFSFFWGGGICISMYNTVPLVPPVSNCPACRSVPTLALLFGPVSTPAQLCLIQSR